MTVTEDVIVKACHIIGDTGYLAFNTLSANAMVVEKCSTPSATDTHIAISQNTLASGLSVKKNDSGGYLQVVENTLSEPWRGRVVACFEFPQENL